MAGYATAVQIASEFKFTTFDANTPVTPTELDEWSEQFSRTLDGYLIKQYDVPITGVNSLSVVSLLVRGWVAGRAARILNSTVGIGETELNKAFSLEKFSNQWIKDFKAGCIEFEDAKQKDRLAPKSFNQANAIDPLWEKGVDQW